MYRLRYRFPVPVECSPPCMSDRADDPFATTRWTVVLQAGGPEPGRTGSLEALCRDYWQPVFVYIRMRGHDEDSARDLTQEFFAQLLAKDWLDGLKREGSRFRAFLIVAVKRFLAVSYHRCTARKRGGGAVTLPLDSAALPAIAAREATPEQAFDRHWSLTVINRALESLRQEVESAGRGRLFSEVAEFISSDPEPGAYEAVGSQLGISRSAVAMAVHRLRLRLREKVREEISQTLSDPGQVDDEMRELLAALRG